MAVSLNFTVRYYGTEVPGSMVVPTLHEINECLSESDSYKARMERALFVSRVRYIQRSCDILIRAVRYQAMPYEDLTDEERGQVSNWTDSLKSLELLFKVKTE